jgi:hypothetical protein
MSSVQQELSVQQECKCPQCQQCPTRPPCQTCPPKDESINTYKYVSYGSSVFIIILCLSLIIIFLSK